MTIAELIEKEKELMQQQHETEINKLLAEADKGSIGDSKWLEQRIGMNMELIKERILYPFRQELEGQIIFYSDRKGVPWRVNKFKFNDWMCENFEKVVWG